MLYTMYQLLNQRFFLSDIVAKRRRKIYCRVKRWNESMIKRTNERSVVHRFRFANAFERSRDRPGGGQVTQFARESPTTSGLPMKFANVARLSCNGTCALRARACVHASSSLHLRIGAQNTLSRAHSFSERRKRISSPRVDGNREF